MTKAESEKDSVGGPVPAEGRGARSDQASQATEMNLSSILTTVGKCFEAGNDMTYVIWAATGG